LRADAQRNIDSLLEAAKTVFGTAGVDAPAKQIADLAGVGVGTLYRHFPQRSDLVKAVFQREVEACANAATALAAAHEPGAALAKWLHRYTEFLATKRGLATALHSGDPAYCALPAYFNGGAPHRRATLRRRIGLRMNGQSIATSPRRNSM
jgi:AcrR family transcriptional regulator